MILELEFGTGGVVVERRSLVYPIAISARSFGVREVADDPPSSPPPADDDLSCRRRHPHPAPSPALASWEAPALSGVHRAPVYTRLGSIIDINNSTQGITPSPVRSGVPLVPNKPARSKTDAIEDIRPSIKFPALKWLQRRTPHLLPLNWYLMLQRILMVAHHRKPSIKI